VEFHFNHISGKLVKDTRFRGKILKDEIFVESLSGSQIKHRIST